MPSRRAVLGGAAGMVAGGNPPMRPDQLAGLPRSRAGTGPAPQNVIFIGRLVIISSGGPSTGLFVYNGSPGLGNPPILAITTASSDPYGNPVTPSAITDLAMPFLIYSGPPALGNLIASIAPAAGTDAFGNAYQIGFASYGVTSSVEMDRGLVEFFPVGGYSSGVISGTSTLPGVLNFISPGQTVADVVASMRLRSSLEALGTGIPVLEVRGGLELENQSAPGAATGYAGLFANNNVLGFVSGTDGNTYDTGRLTLLTASAQTISSTSATGITGLSKAVAAGTYRIRGRITYVGDQAGGVPTFSFTGPAIGGTNTNQSQEFTLAQAGGGTSPETGWTRGLAYISTAGPTLVLNQFVWMDYDLKITFSAAGTLQAVASTSIGADTFTIQTFSDMTIEPVVAS